MTLESNILNVERNLTKYAACPILGSLPALCKIALGLLQMLVAFVIMIFAALASLCSSDAQKICKRSFSHVVHGFGNVCAGILEVIPFIGSLTYLLRGPKCNPENVNKQFDKVVAYKLVIAIEIRPPSGVGSMEPNTAFGDRNPLMHAIKI